MPERRIESCDAIDKGSGKKAMSCKLFTGHLKVSIRIAQDNDHLFYFQILLDWRRYCFECVENFDVNFRKYHIGLAKKFE